MSSRFQLESATFHGQIEFRISTFGSPKSNSISKREGELDVFISQKQLVGTAIRHLQVSSVCLSLVSNAKGANRRSQTRAGKTIKVIEKHLFNTGGNAKRFLRLFECRSCSASFEILISANSKLSVHKHQRHSLPKDRVLSD